MKTGTIISFTHRTARGKVNVHGKNRWFSATSFDSGRPARFPRVGDLVDVALSEDGSGVVRLFLIE